MVNEQYADTESGGIVGRFYRDLGEVGWRLLAVADREGPVEIQVSRFFGFTHQVFDGKLTESFASVRRFAHVALSKAAVHLPIPSQH